MTLGWQTEHSRVWGLSSWSPSTPWHLTGACSNLAWAGSRALSDIHLPVLWRCQARSPRMAEVLPFPLQRPLHILLSQGLLLSQHLQPIQALWGVATLIMLHIR